MSEAYELINVFGYEFCKEHKNFFIELSNKNQLKESISTTKSAIENVRLKFLDLLITIQNETIP
jgi:hypothetical protein